MGVDQQRLRSTSTASSPAMANVPPPTMTTLNPFRANLALPSTSTTSRTESVDKGVEAFKRLMFSNTKDSNHETTAEPEQQDLTTGRVDDTSSFQSRLTERS